MRRIIPILTLLLLAACSSDEQGAAERLVLTHAIVIDMTGAEPQPDMTVVIEGNRIADLYPSSEREAPSGATVVDATGKYVIPGLWDMHAHTVSKDIDFQMEVANGITGIRDMGGSSEYPVPGHWGIHFDTLKAWREEIRAGQLIGPRIVAGGIALDGPDPRWPNTLTLSTPEAGRRAVDSLKQAGVDFIKVYGYIPRDIYMAVAEASRAAGLPFAGHPSGAGQYTLMEASEAGQHSIEHGYGLEPFLYDTTLYRAYLNRPEDSTPEQTAALYRSFLDSFDPQGLDSLAAVFVRNGTWLDPTLMVNLVFSAPSEDTRDSTEVRAYATPRVRQQWAERISGRISETMAPLYVERYRHALATAGALHQKGVPLLAGADAWNPNIIPGFSLHTELELLVKAGLTPQEALQAATLKPAQYLEATDSLGTIEPGKLADLVVLDANPLEDIRNTRSIHAVVLNGRLLDRSTLDGMLEGARATAAR